jgi:hypothetical protein
MYLFCLLVALVYNAAEFTAFTAGNKSRRCNFYLHRQTYVLLDPVLQQAVRG